MTTNNTGVYRRCGCTRPSGRRWGSACPRLADPKHGSWYYTAQPATPDGHGRRVRRGGYRTAAAACKARALLLTPGQAGRAWTVARWLQHWLDVLPGQVRPSTLDCYRHHITTYLIPHLGAITLSALTVGQVQDMFTAIAACGDCGRPVTANTLHRIRATLRRALNIAIRDQLLSTNPARAVVLPRPVRHRPIPWTDNRIAAWRDHGERPVVAVWTPVLLARFLAVVRDDPLFVLWWLVALRGLRRAEVCGLRWVDLDLIGRSLTVCRQVYTRHRRWYIGPVKTPSGERSVALDSATIALLRWHRGRQDKRRRVMGAGWRGGDWIFTQADGRPIRPDWLTHRFTHLVTMSGLPPIRFHDLRHGAGSLTLTAGYDVKIVQDLLGHASYAFTADTYALVLPDLALQAAEQTAHLILAALAEVRPPT